MILIHLSKIYILLFVSIDKVKGVKRSTEKRKQVVDVVISLLLGWRIKLLYKFGMNALRHDSCMHAYMPPFSI